MKKHKTKTSKEKLGLKGLALLAAASVVTVAITAFAVLWSFFAPRRTDSVTLTVPDFVGMPEGDIQVSRSFALDRKYEYSDNVEAGRVISQSPAAKSKRKSAGGEKIELSVTVSLGKKSNVVPDVTGMPYVSAAIKLRELGADVLSVSVYDTDGEIGRVLRCEPPAGTKIEQGQRVLIYVSRSRPKETVKVPNLEGLSVERACIELMVRGLVPGQIQYEVECEQDPGTVINQGLPSGMYIMGGTRVDLTVSGLREAESDDDFAESQEREQEENKMPWWHFW